MITRQEVEDLVTAILASAKYRALARETVAHVVETEAAHGPKNRKELEKLARFRLHRILAEYLGFPHFAKARRSIEGAFASGDDGQIRTALLSILEIHRSTEERIPALGGFYASIFAATGQPRSIIDLACALNPLAYRWMGLSPECHYIAVDINREILDLVQAYFALESISAQCLWTDALCLAEMEEVDVAFLFKMYHCLEMRRKGAGWQAVAAVRARKCVITLPSVALNGRQTDIAGMHVPDLAARCAQEGWPVERLDLRSEIAYVVTKC